MAIPANQLGICDSRSSWSAIKAAVINYGWCAVRAPASHKVLQDLGQLGPLLPSRGGGEYQDLIPYDKASAPPKSMSAFTGMGKQPMHTDGAFTPCPPRFVALQCLNAGEEPCPTILSKLDLSRIVQEAPPELRAATWLSSRGGGQTPFYCSVVETYMGNGRVRFDPLCMRQTDRTEKDVSYAHRFLSLHAEPCVIEWEDGLLLLIDNWECLHARGEGAETAGSRKLRRWLIGG